MPICGFRIGFWAIVATALSACALEGDLPKERPPLSDLEEPVALLAEPDDEAQRRELPKGAFTGVYVKDSRIGLDAQLEEPEGVLIERIVENSPGALAALEVGDLILQAKLPQDAAQRPIDWPSAWRELELAAAPGEAISLWLDRGGRAMTTRITTVPRVAAPEREAAERFREETRVGVVLRTATEVEARAAGLAPGAGAVVVGLSRSSPWRAAGVRFEDLIAAIDGAVVPHPQFVLERIREAEAERGLRLSLRRAGESLDVLAMTSERTSRMRDLHIPPLFRREQTQDRSKTTVLYGLFGYEATEAAWEFTFLWFLTFSGGDDTTLEEVQR